MNEALAVSYGPMNRLINTAEWAAQFTALSWDEVADADLYRIELTDKDDHSTTVTVDMSGNLPEIIINGQNTFAVAGDDWYTVKQGSAVNGRYSLINVQHLCKGLRQLITAFPADLAVGPREQHG